MKQGLDFNEVFQRLQRSRFRMRFKLNQDDLAYIEKIGSDKMRLHASDFIQKRLAPAFPDNDGKQTPFKGHPIFKAQHATATCCRNCLYKWYAIPKGRVLTGDECRRIICILLEWIKRDIYASKNV